VSTMNDTLPPLPRINHPEPHTYRFTDLERAYIARHKANAAPATPSPAPDCED
jgi:hypothetical protein